MKDLKVEDLELVNGGNSVTEAVSKSLIKGATSALNHAVGTRNEGKRDRASAVKYGGSRVGGAYIM